jgi:uncharacterized membrane protein YhiD involved in acid resistance
LRLSIVVLIAVLIVGSIVISLGFLTNEEPIKVSEILTPYEKLEKYKNELEKINQNNLQILENLKEQIKNSDDVHLEKINEEIAVVTRVINENKVELEKVIQRLSQMDSDS